MNLSGYTNLNVLGGSRRPFAMPPLESLPKDVQDHIANSVKVETVNYATCIKLHNTLIALRLTSAAGGKVPVSIEVKPNKAWFKDADLTDQLQARLNENARAHERANLTALIALKSLEYEKYRNGHLNAVATFNDSMDVMGATHITNSACFNLPPVPAGPVPS